MEHLKRFFAIVLSASLAAPAAPAQNTPPSAQPVPSPPHAKSRAPYKSTQLEGDQRILHALNRFTFGPRPGDLEAVRTQGLDAWFESQLQPASINNSALSLRLAAFPAMQWSTEDLLYRLPSDTVIRQAADGKAPLPQSGALRSVYVNQIDRYALRKARKEEKKQESAAANPPAAPGSSVTPRPAMTETEPANSQVAASADQSASQADPQTASMSMAAPRAEEPVFPEKQSAWILGLPPAQRVAELARLNQEDFDAFRKSLRPPQRKALTVGLTPDQAEVVLALENPKNLVNSELCEQRLTRDIYTNAQLQEVMTDFWMNHFNVFLHKNDETPYYLVSYERDVIRPLALGKFEDLLEATAHSPAMLLYLDNATSIGPDSLAAARAERNPNNKKKAREGLNENYARELMELHTLGVNGGYTQKDVTEVARVFTGWTVDRPARGGGFEFDERKHEPGSKTVLGKKIKEHGEREGRDVLHMLAARPATAQFLSRKLAIRFVSDEPPQSLVDRLAKTYMSSDGDIRSVLRTLFRSPEFWAADDYRAKVKTPLEFVVSSLRASNAQIGDPPEDLKPVVNALQGMGMPLYGAVPPTGYSWVSSNWVSAGALVNRMNFALSLAANKMGGLPDGWTPRPDVTLTPPQAGAAPIEVPTAEAEEHRLEDALVAGGVSDSTRAALLDQLHTQLGTSTGSNLAVAGSEGTAQVETKPAAIAKPVYPAQAARALEKQDELLAGLLLGSPEFQRR